MIQKRVVLCLRSAALPAVLSLAVLPAVAADRNASPRIVVSRDASGRVQKRVVLNTDGSRHVTATEYWPYSSVASHTVDEDIDRAGRPTARTVQEFDQRGRLRERRAVSIDAAGRESGTRTRYTYDAHGRVDGRTSPVER